VASEALTRRTFQLPRPLLWLIAALITVVALTIYLGFYCAPSPDVAYHHALVARLMNNRHNQPNLKHSRA
jgi:uncharacterized membrane protein YoaK (UPF0700 family)